MSSLNHMEATTYALESQGTVNAVMADIRNRNSDGNSKTARHVSAEVAAAIAHLDRWDLTLVIDESGHASLNEPTEDGSRPLMIWIP